MCLCSGQCGVAGSEVAAVFTVVDASDPPTCLTNIDVDWSSVLTVTHVSV